MTPFMPHHLPRPKALEEQHTTCSRTFTQLRVLKNLIGAYLDNHTTVVPTRLRALAWGLRCFIKGTFPSDKVHIPFTTLLELYRDIDANLSSLEYMNKEDKF